MHEYTTAAQIWRSIAEAARRHGEGRVISAEIELGELNLLGDEQISFWVTRLAEQAGSPDLKIAITHLPARVKCRDCQAEGATPLPEGELDHHITPTLTCPVCGSENVEITGGKEIKVVSARITPAPPPSP
jgi:hydrogenase nickel incorporation protein HypA/HybF